MRLIIFCSEMIYLVTELCVGGELKQLLLQRNFFTEDETKHIICCLADAVDYLHKRSKSTHLHFKASNRHLNPSWNSCSTMSSSDRNPHIVADRCL